jgi:hypothetical protein
VAGSDDVWARIRAASDKARAAHLKKREELGLEPEAGTGMPEPGVTFDTSSAFDAKAFDDLLKKYAHLGGVRIHNAATAELDRQAQERLPLGASRLGGVPDLPPGVAWPTWEGRKLPFLAQIDLTAVPARRGALLPSQGWLYAFGLFGNDPANEPPPVVVMREVGDRSVLDRAAPPGDGEIWPFRDGKSVYNVVPLLPKRRDPAAAGAKAGRRGGREDACDLLGDFDHVFGTPGSIADEELRGGDDWINLLTLHSVGSMQWNDCGYLYILIRRTDLAAGDFSQVCATIRSS